MAKSDKAAEKLVQSVRTTKSAAKKRVSTKKKRAGRKTAPRKRQASTKGQVPSAGTGRGSRRRSDGAAGSYALGGLRWPD